MTPVQVLTVDDQPVFLEAARALIASTPGFALAGEATSGAEAITAVERLHPDMVLLDVRIPGLDGIEVARRLSAGESHAVVVLVTGHDVADVQTLAEQAGAVALVLKERLRPALLRELWASHGSVDVPGPRHRPEKQGDRFSVHRRPLVKGQRVVLTGNVTGLPLPLVRPAHGVLATAPGLRTREQMVSSTLLALLVVGLSSLVAVLVLAASGGTDRVVGRIALHVLVVATPVATGLYAIRSQRTERFGRLLIVTGFLWSLAVLAESSSSLAYSTGRVIAWLIVPMLVYIMLSFPEGRITSRRDRILFGSVTALAALLCIASAPFVEQYPAHSPWASCDVDCPPNAFLVVANEPALVHDVLSPARDLLAALLLIGVTVSLGLRVRGPSTMRLVTAAPVFAVSIVATLVLVVFTVVRLVAPEDHAADAIALVWALCLPAMAVAFCLGLVQRRLLIGNMLTGMSGALSASLEPRHVAAALRSTMGDSVVDVLIRDRDRELWLRDDGRVADPSEVAGTGRVLREISDDRGPVAAVVLDEALDASDALTDAIVSLTEAALREAKLKAELATSLGELDDSRKRIATAADAERRRIERDLHDGAQQRLIALRMRLSLAEDLLHDDPVAASGAIHDLGEDVDHALEEIRALAHGIYPALLADRGLADALRSVARRASLPVTVDAAGLTRHPPEIESAVYFSCLEALQNMAKHASSASGAQIALSQSTTLDFEVSDDGPGFDPAQTRPGTGFRNMRDRVESLGGRLWVLFVEGSRLHGPRNRPAATEHVQAEAGCAPYRRR